MLKMKTRRHRKAPEFEWFQIGSMGQTEQEKQMGFPSPASAGLGQSLQPGNANGGQTTFLTIPDKVFIR